MKPGPAASETTTPTIADLEPEVARRYRLSGSEAYLVGLSACPYEPMTAAALEWLTGWASA